MRVKKKASADYGLFCFRLTKKERNELDKLLNNAKARLNKDRSDDDYKITKNKILFEAIKLGVPLVKLQN
jgi:hypothetical protein